MKSRHTSKKHCPVRYRRFKGCFGNPVPFRREHDKNIQMPPVISLTPDEHAETLFRMIEYAFNHPDRVLDFRKLKQVTIRGGIILRAFRDEFMETFRHAPSFKPPKNRKMKAVLQFLGYADYGMEYSEYEDIECWDIRSWDAGDDLRMANPPKEIMEEVIPKCCGNDILDKNSRNLASAVTEAINNSSEHAYVGSKKDAVFRKWYLGCGIYPGTDRLVFCVYDKGQGFRESMQRDKTIWSFLPLLDKDYKYIVRATEGVSGTKEEGRGQGLKKAVDKLKTAGGFVEIMSGNGFFNSENMSLARDRKVCIEGSVIAFSVPVSYIKREN